jgi:2-amino-4-hydroxy-6-hydroxymethyldihydropteridine diphosphokinase
MAESMMRTHWSIFSIGSNLGDPLSNCRKAIEVLRTDIEMHLERQSPFYWTEPVDYMDQQWFLNAALKVRTALGPLDLLARLQEIQHSMGRKQGGIRFGPRVLDLDIIFYEDLVMDSDGLVIPHPRMHKRRFVLQPICDIDPEVRHPVLGVNVFQLLNQMDKDDQKIRPCCCDC